MVGSHLLTDGGVCHLDMVNACGSEGICSALLGVEIVEHVVLGIDVFAGSLQCSFVVSLVDKHVGLHGCSAFTDGNDIGGSILGPDGSPVLATHVVGLRQRVGLSVVFIVVQCYGIVCHQYDGSTIADGFYGRPRCGGSVCIVNLDDTGAGVTVQIDDGIVEVGFEEVVVGLRVGQLP